MAEESVFDFPCDFPIKVVGRSNPGFQAAIVELVSRHAGPLSDERVSSRLSRDGNFVSVTVNIVAHSRAQLDAIYEELTAHERVMMVL